MCITAVEYEGELLAHGTTCYESNWDSITYFINYVLVRYHVDFNAFICTICGCLI